MNSAEWLAYFRQNKLDRRAILWHEGVYLRPSLRAPLARSLATFQLGESSEGRKLKNEARRLAVRTGDSAYPDAIDLFIAEEHEHSRLLAKILALMDGPLRGQQWSDGLFRFCRHVLSFHGEICVLLMAEIVALKYYSAIHRGAGCKVIETVCEQILFDEKFHVRFHCEYLHRALASKPGAFRALCWCALTLMFAGASTVVAMDHRKLFRVLGGSAREFLCDSWRNFAAARRAMFSGEPFVWSFSKTQAGPQALTIASGPTLSPRRWAWARTRAHQVGAGARLKSKKALDTLWRTVGRGSAPPAVQRRL